MIYQAVISTEGRLNRRERFEQPKAGPKGEGQEPVVNFVMFGRSLTFVRDDRLYLCQGDSVFFASFAFFADL